MSSAQPHPTGAGEAPRPKLLFVRSETSGRSRRVEGYLAQVLQRRHNHETFDIVWIDADAHPTLAERLGVETAPELLVIDEGEVQARLTAPGGCDEIRRFLDPWLK